MLAYQIIRHSCSLLLRNWRAFLTITALPALLLVLSNTLRIKFINAKFAPDLYAAAPSPGLLILSALLTLASLLWVAVGWHRFVLLNEPPRLLPRIMPGRMLAYLGYSILISLLLLLILGPLLFLLAFSVNMASLPGKIVLFMLSVGVTVIALRLGAGLPGAALGEHDPLARAWQATKNHMGVFVLLAFICILARHLMSYLVIQGLIAMPNGEPLTLGLIATVVDGLVAMISLSVLTTLQGYFVQGRSLG